CFQALETRAVTGNSGQSQVISERARDPIGCSICHSRTGEINPVKVSNLVKLYVQRYKYFRKHGRKMDDEERDDREQEALHSSA
uniref:SFR19-like C-terminal domain-containing protein n=1 Tax=Sander lucioperca TaxID=283035 RepID=A0A8C9ZRT9_SANLU